MDGTLARALLAACFGAALLTSASRAGAQASGVIKGTVRDQTTGAPVVSARVDAVGTGQSARTGPSGAFALRVPPGAHTVEVFAPFYRSATQSGVQVPAGGELRLDFSLAPAAASAVEVLEIVAEAGGDSEAAQLMRRLEAPEVSDSISAEIIRKLPGSDVSAVAKRVPSVTVQTTEDGEKIICVRGLCNRYTIGLVDGLLLPSTNPVKRLVPAEIFPPEFLESLVVYKSFLPNLRGNMPGAQVEFELREPPPELAYSLSASLGGNTQSTFQDFNTYQGAPEDFVGLGEGFRNPPSSLPDGPIRNTEQYQLARSFENIWDIDTVTAPPDVGLKGSVGNTFGPFGFLLAGIYKNEWNRLDEWSRTLYNEGSQDEPEPAIRDAFENDRSIFTTRLAGFLSSTFTPSEDHKLGINAFVNRRSFDETLVQVADPDEGGIVFNLGEGGFQLQRRLKYLEDEVSYGQLYGDHTLPLLERFFPALEVDWRTAFSRSTRDEPDTRHETRQGEELQFVEDSLGGVRISAETRERLSDSALDLRFPFETWLPATRVWNGLEGALQFGGAYTSRDRDFEQRRFRFLPNSATQDTTKPTEVLFAPNNIGPGAAFLREDTNPEDKYDATEEIKAFYGMMELPIIRDRLRVIGGARWEDALIELDTAVRTGPDTPCPGNEDQCDVTLVRDEADWLPGVSLIVSPLDAMNVRFAWNKTVSRPEFRELAPTEFPAQRGQRPSFGNILLVQSEWESWDVRWEWLFGDDELVSLTGFYKEGENPIEKTEVPQAADPAETWINAESTEIWGLEFEGRKNFGFLHDRLDGLSFSTNVTWTPEKETFVPQVQVANLDTQQTNTTRAPVDVPDYIVNATLEYAIEDLLTARLLYQTVGPTITRAGVFGVPDAVRQRADQIDVVLQFPLERWIDLPVTLSLAAENVTNDQLIETQGPFTTKRTTAGVKFGLGITYTY